MEFWMASTKRATAPPVDDRVMRAATAMRDRKARISNPDGKFDNGKRWYPAASERRGCCGYIRHPSRTYPYSLLVHCRTVEHVARLYDLDPEEIATARKIAFADERATRAVKRAEEAVPLRAEIVRTVRHGWDGRGDVVASDFASVVERITSLPLLRALTEMAPDKIWDRLAERLPDRVVVLRQMVARDPNGDIVAWAA
jgi:hypothetical protein